MAEVMKMAQEYNVLYLEMEDVRKFKGECDYEIETIVKEQKIDIPDEFSKLYVIDMDDGDWYADNGLGYSREWYSQWLLVKDENGRLYDVVTDETYLITLKGNAIECPDKYWGLRLVQVKPTHNYWARIDVKIEPREDDEDEEEYKDVKSNYTLADYLKERIDEYLSEDDEDEYVEDDEEDDIDEFIEDDEDYDEEDYDEDDEEDEDDP